MSGPQGDSPDGTQDWSEAEHETGKDVSTSTGDWKPTYLDDIWFYRGILAVLG